MCKIICLGDERLAFSLSLSPSLAILPTLWLRLGWFGGVVNGCKSKTTEEQHEKYERIKKTHTKYEKHGIQYMGRTEQRHTDRQL